VTKQLDLIYDNGAFMGGLETNLTDEAPDIIYPGIIG
jgi:hypothetical protein